MWTTPEFSIYKRNEVYHYITHITFWEKMTNFECLALALTVNWWKLINLKDSKTHIDYTKQDSLWNIYNYQFQQKRLNVLQTQYAENNNFLSYPMLHYGYCYIKTQCSKSSWGYFFSSDKERESSQPEMVHSQLLRGTSGV